LRHEENALLVPVKDGSLLSFQLDRALADENFRNKLRTQARKDYEEYFTFEKMIAGYSKIFEELHES
jgi:glycosyltransferase involved in cell wall biosynthesis